MPISAYFSGHGNEVMRQMQKKHGMSAGKSEFYATINAGRPGSGKKKKLKKGRRGKNKESDQT